MLRLLFDDAAGVELLELLQLLPVQLYLFVEVPDLRDLQFCPVVAAVFVAPVFGLIKFVLQRLEQFCEVYVALFLLGDLLADCVLFLHVI